MGWLSSFTMAVAFLAVGLIFSPETFKSDGSDSSSPAIIDAVNLSHLLCFSSAWGAALCTFIGGIIMFRTLPRHQFGNLRSKIFPAYFAMVGFCCSISIATFGYLHPWKSASSTEKYQLGFMSFGFFFNLSSLLIFTPMTIEMMKKRHKVERKIDIGEDVGSSKSRKVAKSNPQLASINRKFDIIHAFSALAYVLAFVCLTMHSWYLARKLNL
ncbi:uncharacterized protein LOC141652916 isoform X2 [Silene latifolia]|uniref:uncharacterized protein LOC141652916 isoform X2 n=1 Tax=Silene latifolia TaxID=37657 RepID=UPI003D7759D5